MARPRKEGMDYFSFDVDFFSDKKIKILKARYGADGIVIYLYLLCEIYKNGYCLKVDDDFEFIISDDLGMNCDKVKQVLTFLLERSMFDKQLFQSDAVLTSTGIQKRFQLMVKTRASKNPITVKGFWLLSEEETEPFIKVNPILNNSDNNICKSEKNKPDSEKYAIKESKVNKSKVNKSKVNKNIEVTPPDGSFSNKELENAFQLFITCRRQNGQKLAEEQIHLLREELVSIGKDDTERIAIANKATVSGWKSFYPLKKADQTKQKRTDGNRFNNFNQRKYDYQKLEQQLLNSEKGDKHDWTGDHIHGSSRDDEEGT